MEWKEKNSSQSIRLHLTSPRLRLALNYVRTFDVSLLLLLLLVFTLQFDVVFGSKNWKKRSTKKKKRFDTIFFTVFYFQFVSTFRSMKTLARGHQLKFNNPLNSISRSTSLFCSVFLPSVAFNRKWHRQRWRSHRILFMKRTKSTAKFNDSSNDWIVFDSFHFICVYCRHKNKIDFRRRRHRHCCQHHHHIHSLESENIQSRRKSFFCDCSFSVWKDFNFVSADLNRIFASIGLRANEKYIFDFQPKIDDFVVCRCWCGEYARNRIFLTDFRCLFDRWVEWKWQKINGIFRLTDILKKQ